MRGLARVWQLLGIKSGDAVRVVLLALVCVGIGLLVVDYGGGSSEPLEVGDVASRTVKAPRSYPYNDETQRAIRQSAARAAVHPVYEHQSDLVGAQTNAIRRAFVAAREDLGLPRNPNVEPTPLSPEARAAVREVFQQKLGVAIQDRDLDVLIDADMPQEAAERMVTLLRQTVVGLIVADRADLPDGRVPMTVVESNDEGTTERVVGDYEAVRVPEEIRREIDVRAAMSPVSAGWAGSAQRIARALVEPNLLARPAETSARREAAAAAVAPVQVFVKRGTVLFRDGEELDEQQILRYRAMSNTRGNVLWLQVLSVVFFAALLVFGLVQFASTNLRGFSLSVRDVAAAGVLVLLTTVLTRAGVGLSGLVATLVGYDCAPSSVWFAIPVAAAPMLMRLLVGVNWALLTSVVVAAVCGLMMDLDALMVLFVFFSGVVATGSVHQTRERLSVLRAGLVVGVANAAMALLIHFLGFYSGEGELLGSVSLLPVWSMAFAFLGGLVGSFLVLGLMPVFESAGFVTDYRLMELANLNHPLMRQLMLRAPGSYHHSVVVGSLAEAACEEIGANALQTRVAAYFHDIGKSLKPQYYVENQGSGGNKHVGLDPYTSAAIIVSHVTDGADLARQHRLPKPCIDNIYMHHGTGLLQYFYARAVDMAGGDESAVDEAAFRYPGPRPDSKESGILMLADKVEAATRTIAEPNEDKFRSMIHAIINSVMADNQFEDCPLTFKELYTISDAFVGVLMGIHHQRIEYPQTAHLTASRKDVPPPPRQNRPDIITLEMPSEAQRRQVAPMTHTPQQPQARVDVDAPTAGDYESVEHLPGSEPKA
ncbi:MAG: HD family phosphohydrolase [Myxococcota bacterium]